MAERESPDSAAPGPSGDFSDTERVRRDLLRLQKLQRVNHVLNAEKDLDRLLEIVMDSVIELSGAERGFLILKGTSDNLDNARIVARHMDREEIRAPEGCISSTIARQVLETGQTVLTPDANADARFARKHSVRVLRLRSVLCFPLRVQDEVIGAIYVDAPDRAEAFSPEDVQDLSSFADPAAIALQNAKLHRQLVDRKRQLTRANRHLRGLIETARGMMAERDVSRLLPVIVDQATRVTEAERSTLFLVDESRGMLVSKITRKGEPGEIAIPIGTGIAGQVAATRKPLNVPEAQAHPQFDPRTDHRTGFVTRNILAAPLLTHDDKVLGVIQVLNKRKGSFSEHDEELLGALAAQAATALENHQLVKHYLRMQQMEHDLHLARKVQALLLPARAPSLVGLDVAAFYQSAEETGGDYYDFFRLSPTRLGIIIADVSGHGIGAALLMATARAALRAYMESTSDLSGALRRLNRTLVQDMSLERYMTLLLCVLDLEREEMTYTNAGHAVPLFYRPAEDRFLELEERSMPLGMVLEPTFSQSASIPLVQGDVLLLMTDGVWEAASEKEEAFGRERVAELIRSRHAGSVRELIGEIRSAVTAHCQPLAIGDDFTLIGVKKLARGEAPAPAPRPVEDFQRKVLPEDELPLA